MLTSSAAAPTTKLAMHHQRAGLIASIERI